MSGDDSPRGDRRTPYARNSSISRFRVGDEGGRPPRCALPALSTSLVGCGERPELQAEQVRAVKLCMRLRFENQISSRDSSHWCGPVCSPKPAVQADARRRRGSHWSVGETARRGKGPPGADRRRQSLWPTALPLNPTNGSRRAPAASTRGPARAENAERRRERLWPVREWRSDQRPPLTCIPGRPRCATITPDGGGAGYAPWIGRAGAARGSVAEHRRGGVRGRSCRTRAVRESGGGFDAGVGVRG